MASTFQRIAIIGSGAVGCYYGGRLALHGREVLFHMRRDLEQVRAHGLTVRSCLGDFSLPQVQAYGRTEEMGAVDLVLITLKATANGALESLVPPLLGPHTKLLTLQNGLGNEEFLAERWGAERVLGGVCFTCINRTGPGLIEHTAQGQIALGAHGPENAAAAEAAAALFNASGVECALAESIPAVRWRKLVWNIPFNGLAILGGGIDTARILADPHLSALTRALMVEVMECSAALGHPLPEWLPEDQFVRTETMRAYRPSSMIDFVEGREVEVEAIWGEPFRRAVAAGVNAGRMEALYRLISAAVAARGATAG
jgi:2-dehydropantoate 2-reductase